MGLNNTYKFRSKIGAFTKGVRSYNENGYCYSKIGSSTISMNVLLKVILGPDNLQR